MKPQILFVCWAAGMLLSRESLAQLQGTLFSTPEERAYLDYLRQDFLARSQENGFDIQPTTIPDIPVAEETAAAPSGQTRFTLGGIMTRADGTRSIWINNQLFAESALPSGFSVPPGSQPLQLQVRHQGRTWTLRPGQTLDLLAGTVTEAWQQPSGLPPLAEDTTAGGPVATGETATEGTPPDPEPQPEPDNVLP